MKKIVLLMLASILSLSAKTDIVVSYTYNWFDPLHKKLKEEFEKKYPKYNVVLRAPSQTYEDGASKLMREKIVKKLPHVAFVSFNYLLPLTLKNVPMPLDTLLTKEDKEQNGYTATMLNPSTINGTTYGIPFAASLPVVYFNTDLVKKANWNKELPKTWDEMFELSAQVNKLDNKHSMYFENYADNWLFMALVMSQNEKFIKNGKIGFNTKKGTWAVEKLSQMHSIAKMPNFDSSSAKKSFMAGNLAAYIGTSAMLTTFEKAIGSNFVLKTAPFVNVVDGGELPVGGSVAIITSLDEKSKEGVLKYIKYVTGKIGNAYVPQFTGYMPTNQLALKTLSDFYKNNPNQRSAPSQLPLMGAWPSYPGNNALKISDVLHDYIHLLLSGERKDYQKVLEQMSEKANNLLP